MGNRRYSIYSIKDGGERRARGISELRGQESTPWTHKSFIYKQGLISQAGRRGFEPRLPLHVFNNLAVSIGPLGACYLSEMECSDSNPLIPRDFSQDQLIQQELLRRNDLPANVFLLLRHTGMRIGECADLSCDCLHNVGPDRWAIHVPLGKLKTERMVPVDSFVCDLVQRYASSALSTPCPPMAGYWRVPAASTP